MSSWRFDGLASTSVDAFSRRIVGWRVAAHMRTDMVLDALEMARRSCVRRRLIGLVTHADAGSRITSVRFTERLEDLGSFEPPGYAPTGRSVDLPGIEVLRFRDGLIWRYRSVYNYSLVPRQLGLSSPRRHRRTRRRAGPRASTRLWLRPRRRREPGSADGDIGL